MMQLYFILVDKKPVAASMSKHSAWCKAQWEAGGGEKVVGKTKVGDVDVSTVFLGINHNYKDGPPILFETMIFGGEHDQYQERYHTWDEAQAGHERALALVSEKPCTKDVKE